MREVILVTGSEGLIGDAIVQALSPQYRVAGFDIERKGKDPEKLDFIPCDLTKDESVQKAVDQLQSSEGSKLASVVHLAGYYDFSGDPSPLYRELTVEGTRRLLRALQHLEVEQFIFSSTHILMKPSEDGAPVTESSPIDPAWAYPKSKLETEQVIQRERGRIPAVVLRIAGVYNEQGHAVPIAQQIERIASRDLESYFFPGDATTGQAFVHLDDLVTCIRRAIERRRELDPYEVFLVAEEDKMSYEELQDQIGELVHGSEWPTIRIPKVMAKAGAWMKEKIQGPEDTFIRPWMIDLADDDYPISNDKARDLLNWRTQHSLRATLPKIVENRKKDPQKWREENGIASQ